MAPPRPALHLAVALACEAAPVISRFDLERIDPGRGFPLYRGRNIALVISGVGKVNAAAGVAYLQAAQGCPADARWLNLGIAGHGERALGEPFVARRITDMATGRVWNPFPAFDPPCATETLTTLDRPGRGYPEGMAFDMEAAGFFATAIRFASRGRVQCLKVVSDNRNHPAGKVDADIVSALIEARLDLLGHMLHLLRTTD